MSRDRKDKLKKITLRMGKQVDELLVHQARSRRNVAAFAAVVVDRKSVNV